MKNKIIMAILGGILVTPFSVFAANVTDTGPGTAGDVLYYTGPAGNDQGTWSSLPSLVQTIINNNTVVPATVGTSLNSGSVSTVGNIDVTGTGITQTVTGSGATGTSSYDFSNLQTAQGNTNATNITNLTSTVNGNSTDISSLQTTVANHTTQINQNTSDISSLNTTVSNHTTQISNLQGGLSQEVLDRQAGDANLQSQVDTHTGQITSLTNGLNTTNTNVTNLSNKEASDVSGLQNGLNNEAATRASADQALQNQINNVNAQAQDNTNRIDRLEQTKYLLEPVVRLYDSKLWQVQAFDSYDVRHGMNSALGMRVMLKLGKSYEEKLLSKTNPEIARLLAANVSHDIAERDAIRKQLAEDRALITEQAALLKQLSQPSTVLSANVSKVSPSKVLPTSDEDLLQALDERNEAFVSK